MIQLKPDCLILQTGDGTQIPCSAEWITFELIGESAEWLDRNMLQNAAAAVLHYFKNEAKRDFVSVGEFAVALERVLRGFGLSVYTDTNNAQLPIERDGVMELNLQELASRSGKGFELMFFPNLRTAITDKMGQSPQMLRFRGLRGCVKQLVGAERWSRQCQSLNDQIVDYLRTCWQTQPGSQSCALVVQ